MVDHFGIPARGSEFERLVWSTFRYARGSGDIQLYCAGDRFNNAHGADGDKIAEHHRDGCGIFYSEHHHDVACERPGGGVVFTNVGCDGWHRSVYVDIDLRYVARGTDAEFIDGPDQRNTDSNGECHLAHL